MTEELGKDIALEATKAVALEVYKDVAQPTMKAVGSIVALPFQAIDAALSNAKLWVEEKHYNFERTRVLLAEKMKDVPPENIVSPENYVAVPAMKQIAYCFDSEELREMYANLLASSMQTDKKWKVHPAFVDIIKQLTPDEAKVLKYLDSKDGIYPLIDLHVEYEEGGYVTLISNYTNEMDMICDYPENISSYLENLDRLKIIEIDKMSSLTNKDYYEKIKKATKIRDIINKPLSTGKYEIKEGLFRPTEFGKEFINVCIS